MKPKYQPGDKLYSDRAGEAPEVCYEIISSELAYVYTYKCKWYINGKLAVNGRFVTEKSLDRAKHRIVKKGEKNENKL